jgi:hypothetical protein
MSDRSDLRLNRRRLLLAMSTVGTVGALTGRGAAAYLTDRETLADNRMIAGAVTLTLDGVDTARTTLGFTIDDYGFQNRDEATVCLGLGEESNPAWVWIRACPVAEIADELDARLVVDGATVYMDSLAALLSELADGALLSELAGAGRVPNEPGDGGPVCLTLSVWAPQTLASDPDTVRALKAASPFTVTLDAYAEQSRHVPTPRNPAEGLNPSFTFPACEPPTTTTERWSGTAISNVSLCTSGPLDPSAIAWTILDPDTSADVTGSVDEPLAVRIESTVPIQYAVVKAGPAFRRFDVGGATAFTLDSTGGALLDDVPRNFSRCACEGDGLKIDWNDDAGAFDSTTTLSCGDDADGSQTAEPSNGGPPTGDPPSAPPGRPARGPSSTDDGRDDAPGTNGGRRPPNGDDK